MKKQPLFDDDESYTNANGLMVFTPEYLLKRGYCCGNGCLNCPFEYKNVVDLAKKQRLLDARKNQQINTNQTPHA